MSTLNYSKTQRFLVLTLIVCVVMSFSTKEKAIESSAQNPFITAVDNAVREQMIKQDLVGVAVGIVQNGEITHLKGYGYSNREKNSPITTKTPMRWASISKVLTAVAAFQLIENGDMERNTKVSDYVNYWPSNSKITIDHLLSHRSGIQQYGSGTGNTKYRYTKVSYRDKFKTIWNPQQSVKVFKSAPLDFTPGTKFLYSSFAYNLLGAAIHENTPNGYQNWVNNTIKNPLGLSSLRVSNNDWFGYNKNCKGDVARIADDSKMWVLPAGGWISNIEDATRFMQGLINEELLENTDALYTGLSGNGGYDFGMRSTTICGVRWRGHGGSHKNLKNTMFYNPITRDGIIIMSNTGHTSRTRFFESIVEAIGLSCTPYPEAVNAKCAKSDCNDLKTAAVWRKNVNDAIIRHGYTKEAFYKEWQKLTSIGYHCEDIETYRDDNKRKWSGIFKKGATKSAMWRSYSTKEFNTKWKEMSNKGFRLIDIETYLVNGKRKWDGLFVNGSGRYALFRNYNATDFAKKIKKLSKSGYKLIDFEVHTVNNITKWSGVWVKGQTGKFAIALSNNAFGDLHKKMKRDGYNLTDIEVYKVNGKKYWAGIWDKDNNSQKINRNYSYCDLLKMNATWDKDEHEMIDLEIYH
ncbi:serine hydrolase [Lacinutrix salivirga]